MIIQVQFGFNQIDNFFKKNCHLRFPINVKKKKKKTQQGPIFNLSCGGGHLRFPID